MARRGRGFPLGTQYMALWRTVPSNPLSGSGSFTMSASGSMEVIASTPIPPASTGVHKFRSVQTPPFVNFEEVRRYLQRTFDEVAIAVNAVRSVAEGGTGVTSFEGTGILQTTDAEQIQLVPLAVGTLQSDGLTASFAPPGSVSGNAARAPTFLLMGA